MSYQLLSTKKTSLLGYVRQGKVGANVRWQSIVARCLRSHMASEKRLAVFCAELGDPGFYFRSEVTEQTLDRPCRSVSLLEFR
jgi:hypothetical protein